jgi:hypothetical protein
LACAENRRLAYRPSFSLFSGESFNVQQLTPEKMVNSAQLTPKKIFGFDTFCWCIKATSQVQRFDASPEAKSQYVSYSAGDLSFFPQDTIIDPRNFITMRHDTLASAAKRGRYCIEGQMPSDFHGKITSAIRISKLLEPKKKIRLLESIGEPLVPKKSEDV